MADEVKVEMTTEEWGQVMMVLQSGVYRVVAPLLMKINNQLVVELQRNQMVANVRTNLGLVEDTPPHEAADD